jgi:hypothetical protein
MSFPRNMVPNTVNCVARDRGRRLYQVDSLRPPCSGISQEMSPFAASQFMLKSWESNVHPLPSRRRLPAWKLIGPPAPPNRAAPQLPLRSQEYAPPGEPGGFPDSRRLSASQNCS